MRHPRLVFVWLGKTSLLTCWAAEPVCLLGKNRLLKAALRFLFVVGIVSHAGAQRDFGANLGPLRQARAVRP